MTKPAFVTAAFAASSLLPAAGCSHHMATNDDGASDVARAGAGAGDAPPDGAPACEAPFHVGYRIVALANGIRMAVWYPTTAPEASYQYSTDFGTRLALDGAPGACKPVPLVVFSHGAGGCGTQSLFVTESLARAGYVVAAPDHRDAVCAVDDGPKRAPLPNQPSLFDTASWTDASYADRRDDVRAVIDGMLAHPDFAGLIDAGRIGLAGHSLGGYTAVGLGGGWTSWKDARATALLLFSPYLNAYLSKGTLPDVEVPLMYQGADLDLGVTPFLEGPTGAFAVSNPPKYYAKLKVSMSPSAGTHFEWTNLLCGGQKTVADCLAAQPNAKLIVAYSVAFLDRYLASTTEPLLTGGGAGLSAYQHLEN